MYSKRIRGNKFMATGKIGDRIVKKTRKIESKMNQVKDVEDVITKI